MATYIALLRAVNLAGLNKVGMADLRAFIAELGFDDPRTLLMSGNVVFSTRSTVSARLEATLEKAASKKLGVTTDFFVRTAKEWAEAIAGNPFKKEARSDPGHLIMMALKSTPSRAKMTTLNQAIKGREEARVKGKHAYVVYPDGIGRSKLSVALIEKALGTRGTGRNWNTVLKLATLARGA